MWILYALLSAVFAALTSILAKMGLKGVDSTLATALRTIVVLIMAWGMVFVTSAQKGIAALTKQNVLFLVLSGIATGASWLFYFHALKIGDVSKVAPIDKLSIVFTVVLAFLLLRETVTVKAIIGCVLIAAGALVMVL